MHHRKKRNLQLQKESWVSSHVPVILALRWQGRKRRTSRQTSVIQLVQGQPGPHNPLPQQINITDTKTNHRNNLLRVYLNQHLLSQHLLGVLNRTNSHRASLHTSRTCILNVHIAGCLQGSELVFKTKQIKNRSKEIIFNQLGIETEPEA